MFFCVCCAAYARAYAIAYAALRLSLREHCSLVLIFLVAYARAYAIAYAALRCSSREQKLINNIMTPLLSQDEGFL